MKQLDRRGALGSPKLLSSIATRRDKEAKEEVISFQKQFNDLVLQKHIPPPLFWKTLASASCPIQYLYFGGCWEKQVWSWFPNSLLSCFNLSGGFCRIQPSSVVDSASSLFSNIFTGILSYSNLFRHIISSFSEDYLCVRLEI